MKTTIFTSKTVLATELVISELFFIVEYLLQWNTKWNFVDANIQAFLFCYAEKLPALNILFL